MKAAVYTQYGSPEVVQVKQVPKPVAKDNEVLAKVRAATVNRTDAGFRSAEYFISRFWTGIFKPKYQVLGCEFSGVVEAVGSAVTEFKVGDRVFGFNDRTMGGHGEYLTLGAHEAITTMPEHMDFVEAAALTEGAHYAWVDICAAKVQAGQEVMVYGATGAIGSAAVQLLKYVGARVTAVCNTKNVELVKALGADVVVDYQTQDFSQTQTRYDFIFDAVGKSSFKQCKPLLKKKGIYISTELGKGGVNIWLALTTPLWGGKRLLFPLPLMHKEDAVFFKTLAEAGKFKPVIDRKYKLEEIVEAYRYVESGEKTGNVLIVYS